jgi:type II secretory pathway pseudopilin PulG
VTRRDPQTGRAIRRSNRGGGGAAGAVTRRRRGLFLVDVVVGLAILALVGVIFAVAVGRQNRAAQRLGDQREAVRLAEAALTSLQAGGGAAPSPPPLADVSVTVRALPDPPPSPGTRWAEARADVRGRTATLIGAVPAGAVDRAAATTPAAAPAATQGVER